jgi:sulfite reductase alpha subunit-like flavoprotein
MEFLILVGTQTNTAKSAAEDMARDAILRGHKPRVFEMDSFPVMKLPEESLVVFIVATTGEGEAPASMVNTWRFLLRKDLPANSLA